MKKESLRKYNVQYVVKGNRTGDTKIIYVYGEIREVFHKNLVYDTKAILTYDGMLSFDGNKPASRSYEQRVRYFNMGYAICRCAGDKFDAATATKLAKKRFSRNPMSATNGRFLNDDMAMALIENEAKYIANNFKKFAPSIDEDVRIFVAGVPQKEEEER